MFGLMDFVIFGCRSLSIHEAVEMASSTAGSTGWLRGRVKAVTSGDCLVIMALTSSKPGPPPEKTITLSSLMAPKLVTIPCSLVQFVFFIS